MDEKLKNKLVIILAAASLLFLVLALVSYSGVLRQKTEWQKEKVARFTLEEKMNKFNQEKADLEAQVKAKDKELTQVSGELDKTKKALQQETLVSASLKDELSKVLKTKEALQGQLDNAGAKTKKK